MSGNSEGAQKRLATIRANKDKYNFSAWGAKGGKLSPTSFDKLPKERQREISQMGADTVKKAFGK